MELLRSVNPDFTVSQLVALLYIADEEEPLPLPDLRRRAGMSNDGVWKTVQALTEVTCVALDRDDFARLLDTHPRLAVAMLGVLADRLAELIT